MTTSEQIGDLAAALAKAQAEMEGASKDSANPFFKSKYADLTAVWAACRGPLTKHGLSIVQAPRVSWANDRAIVQVETRLLHASGQFISDVVAAAPKDDSPQAVGSVITYLRRYALQSFVGIAPEDDDAEAAQVRRRPQEAAKGAPSGYDEWLKKLEGVADGGSDKLKAAWQSSAPDYRKHLTETDNGRWEALKAQSAMADVKLKLVLR
jgi:hypothetical protein